MEIFLDESRFQPILARRGGFRVPYDDRGLVFVGAYNPRSRPKLPS